MVFFPVGLHYLVGETEPETGNPHPKPLHPAWGQGRSQAGFLGTPDPSQSLMMQWESVRGRESGERGRSRVSGLGPLPLQIVFYLICILCLRLGLHLCYQILGQKQVRKPLA